MFGLKTKLLRYRRGAAGDGQDAGGVEAYLAGCVVPFGHGFASFISTDLKTIKARFGTCIKLFDALRPPFGALKTGQHQPLSSIMSLRGGFGPKRAPRSDFGSKSKWWRNSNGFGSLFHSAFGAPSLAELLTLTTVSNGLALSQKGVWAHLLFLLVFWN